MLRRTLFLASAAAVSLAPGTGCRLFHRDRCDTCVSRPSASVPGAVTLGMPAGPVSALPTGYVPGSAVVVSDTGNPAFSPITYPVGDPVPLRAAIAPANELPAPRIPAPGVPEAPVSKGNPPLSPAPGVPLAPARTTGDLRGR